MAKNTYKKGTSPAQDKNKKRKKKSKGLRILARVLIVILVIAALAASVIAGAVSYTHLDVYKRQRINQSVAPTNFIMLISLRRV